MTENADNLIADLVARGVLVSFWLCDGTTARQRYPWDGGDDLAEAVETTISVAKRSGKGILVESLDSEEGGGKLRFISPSHIVSWTIQPEANLTAALA
jgi:hypothetical protein